MARPFFPSKLPHIPVTDVAGEVVEVGQGVNKFKVARPPEVSAADGAGLPVAALTAHQALTKDAGSRLMVQGQQKNILITGASGNVRLYAIQLAKLASETLSNRHLW
ncbi:hypothetical protein M0R45_010273 [Rubus argutus]|uniref:Uncharacterized protein n=1 Tax=Rubus argutus TaxID=59490 RepID=A0AAW1Y7A3_RUBAR